MFKLSALVAVATLTFSSTAFAGSTPAERLNRVLSVLGQRGVENTEVITKGDQTIVRGTQDGRRIEVRVNREKTVERRIRFKPHTRRPDADDTTSSRPAASQPAPQSAAAPAAQTDEAPKAPQKIDRLANETGLPKEAPASSKDDGLRDLPARDMGAIYDTKDATVKVKRPKFGLGSLDMGKGPRSAPSIAPAQ